MKKDLSTIPTLLKASHSWFLVLKLFLIYVLETWTKVPDFHCDNSKLTNHLGVELSYYTLASAKLACKDLADCGGIYLRACDQSHVYKLSPLNGFKKARSDNGSCTWVPTFGNFLMNC